VGQDNSSKFSKFNGNKPECLASTAEILRPKKKTKVKELSTITLAYMKNKRPDQAFCLTLAVVQHKSTKNL
jgi:hypothetical protein